MKRITEYENITTVSESDVLPIVDVSDTEQASTGSTRKGTIETIADYLRARVETLTGKTLTSPKINEDVEVTATSTEINKLDGVTADTAEINKLDGVTATTAELNKTDGVAGDIVGTTDTQTLTNKTITDPTISGSIALGIGNLVGSLVTINDDAATSFTPDEDIGVILVYARNSSYKSEYALISYRVVATVYTQLLITGTAVEVSTGALTGTTGTDAKFTISTHTDGKIYIENRRGAARSYGYVLLGN